jgi:N-acetylmuramoyl-L-alanine amidase
LFNLRYAHAFAALAFILFQLRPSHAHIFRVVIDPGHGGVDEGTVFDNGKTRVSEKEVTLKLAQKVAYRLQAKGYRVTLTRNHDKEVPLPERTALANRLHADVFISLHMNSTHSLHLTDTQGVETYILNNTTDASSRRLAHLENTVISAERAESPSQWDVALILKDLRLDANLAESKRLACDVQSKLVQATSLKPLVRRRNRGVKQALFHVLLGADMPSILVEAGFLNSPHDRTFVLSSNGQAIMSQAITDAIEQYQRYKNSPKSFISLNKCKIN